MAPDRPVGVGLIGCGTIGQVHAACLGQLVEDGVVRAVAAADLSEARASRGRSQSRAASFACTPTPRQ